MQPFDQTSIATNTQHTQSQTIETSRVLRGRDILCFSHDWSGDPLSKTHVMRILARDNRVLWINSIGYRAPTASKADASRAFNKLMMATTPVREVEKNIFVLNPLAIPAYGKTRLRSFNRALLRFQVLRAMRRLGFKKPLNWIFNPAAAIIAGTLGEDKVIYYCVDEYTAFSGVASSSLAELEEELLTRADLVIVSADLLYQSKARFNPHTFIVRHGVDYTHFRRALDPDTTVPDELANLPRPIIGFHGLIADWVDLELMAEVAKHFSRGSVVMIGKATTNTSVLEHLPNVHFLGRKAYADLPAYCKGFDVAVNPFRISRLTLNANPLKVREYLAAGLQVVSTSIPEVEVLGQCRIGTSAEEFIREIEMALADPGPSEKRSEAIRAESWDARVDEIRSHLLSVEAN
jgi:glycosyltransferase involved in cell wall biosynthesis